MRRLLALMLIALPVGAAAQPWCWDADVVTVEVVGAEVQIAHRADLINCCPDPIYWDVFVGDVTLFVQEHWESPCDCDCCYDLEVTLADVGPGPWILRYSWFDIESGDWVDRSFNIWVPDLGQGYETYVAAQEDSDCLDATSVPPPIDLTWSTLKALHY